MTYYLGKFLHLFIEPVFHWCALLLIIALLRSALRRWLVSGFLAAYILVVTLTPLPFWLLRKLESIPTIPPESVTHEAVVVLGGTSFQYNKQFGQFHLSSSAERNLAAVRLVQQGRAKYLVLLGAAKGHSDLIEDEGDSVTRYAKEAGISPSHVITEKESRSTKENAQALKGILADLGIDSFFLMTSAYHMERSTALFEGMGFTFTPYPVDYYNNYSCKWICRPAWKNLECWEKVIHEFFGILYYKIVL
ncbi:MAG: YdcF family protein [Bdellovibrionaceae bacterium]|nr:YdcF family protein [Pseudobdellovibrionaceae bacterium]